MPNNRGVKVGKLLAATFDAKVPKNHKPLPLKNLAYTFGNKRRLQPVRIGSMRAATHQLTNVSS